MKLDDLLTEGMFSRKPKPRRNQSHARGMERELPAKRSQGHAWRGNLKFEKQAQIFKRFLRQFPANDLMSIYRNAISAGQFSSEELSTVQQAMTQRRWPRDEIQAMSI